MPFERAAQEMAVYEVEVEVLRRKVGTRVVMEGRFPKEFPSVLRKQNAALSDNEKSLVAASIRGA